MLPASIIYGLESLAMKAGVKSTSRCKNLVADVAAALRRSADPSRTDAMQAYMRNLPGNVAPFFGNDLSPSTKSSCTMTLILLVYPSSHHQESVFPRRLRARGPAGQTATQATVAAYSS